MKKLHLKLVTISFFLMIKPNLINAQFTSIKDSKFNVNSGVAIGPETGIALPKVDVLWQLGKKAEQGFYVGAGASMWLIFAGFYSTNVNVGYRCNKLKIENSLAYFKYPRQDQGGTGSYSISFSHFSLNPKICLNIKNATLKIGPSFIIKSDYDLSKKDETQLIDIMKFGKLRYNIELSGSIF